MTTWLKISVSVFDANGIEREVFAETSIWIEPKGKAEFLVELPDLEPDQFKDVEFCDMEDKAPKGCMGWGITDLMGLAI